MKAEQVKHTPGPWRIGDAGRTVFGAKVPGAMPATVAYMPPITPRVDAGERKANRDLMAAAPELLAALQEASRALTNLDPLASVHDAKLIDEALSKALGHE